MVYIKSCDFGTRLQLRICISFDILVYGVFTSKDGTLLSEYDASHQSHYAVPSLIALYQKLAERMRTRHAQGQAGG